VLSLRNRSSESNSGQVAQSSPFASIYSFLLDRHVAEHIWWRQHWGLRAVAIFLFLEWKEDSHSKRSVGGFVFFFNIFCIFLLYAQNMIIASNNLVTIKERYRSKKISSKAASPFFPLSFSINVECYILKGGEGEAV
jgi:hypothetical protein